MNRTDNTQKDFTCLNVTSLVVFTTAFTMRLYLFQSEHNSIAFVPNTINYIRIFLFGIFRIYIH